MKFSLSRALLVKPLQQITGALSGRPTLPIANNILLKIADGKLSLTATDCEVELIAVLPLELEHEDGATTVPSRKFVDICRSLPEDAVIHFTCQDERVLIKSGRSRFTLTTLPAESFPNVEEWESEVELTLPQAKLRKLIEKTSFAMANQDVRYFLNGMLFETENKILRAIATDGHRMAVCHTELDQELSKHEILLPRKGVTELMRLLDQPDELVTLQIGSANLRVQIEPYVFTSKLIDGRFPDYRRVLPKNSDSVMMVNGNELRQALARAAILSNSKFRGVRLNLTTDKLLISSNNPEQEEAEEVMDVQYQGEPLEIGYNVNYLMDVLGALKSENTRFSIADGAVSSLIEDIQVDDVVYVVMPIRL